MWVTSVMLIGIGMKMGGGGGGGSPHIYNNSVMAIPPTYEHL